MFKKTKKLFARVAVPALFVVATIAILGVLLLPRLGGLVPTNSEQANLIGVDNKRQLVENVIFLPQKSVQYALDILDPGNVTLLRAVSVIVAVVSIAAMFRVLQKWHTTRVAVIGTALYTASTFLIHDARSAYQHVGYLVVLPLLLLIGTWLKSKRYVYRLPLAAWLVALLLYIPGVWLFVASAGIVFRKRLVLAWRFVDRRHRITAVAVSLVTLIPLAVGFALNPRQANEWMGFSVDLTPKEALVNLVNIPVDLFYNGLSNPAVWVVGTPIIDVFTAAMFILGSAAYLKGGHPLRARLLVGFAVLSCLLIVLDIVTIGIVVPAVYIVASNGIANMLQSWFVVFPKNPVARNTAVALIVIAMIFVARYHVVRYYDAWPSIQATKDALSMVQYRNR